MLINWLVVSYLAFMGVLVGISQSDAIRPIKPRLLFAHLIAIILLLSLAKPYLSFQPSLHLSLWYAFLTIPIFYWEMTYLAKLFHPKPLDTHIIRWEGALFQQQPSIHLMERFNHRWLSESLHCAYLLYFPLILFLPLSLYLLGNSGAFEFALFAELLTFFLCLITYVFFPVAGPRYCFEKSTDPVSQGVFFRLCHHVLSNHSSAGTAFPSSHVAMATVVLLLTTHLFPEACWLVLPISLGIVFGVVYCRFHYALDSLLGIVYGVAGFLIALALYA